MKLKKQYYRMLKEKEMLTKLTANSKAPIEILGKAFKKLDTLESKIADFEELISNHKLKVMDNGEQ